MRDKMRAPDIFEIAMSRGRQKSLLKNKSTISIKFDQLQSESEITKPIITSVFGKKLTVRGAGQPANCK